MRQRFLILIFRIIKLIDHNIVGGFYIKKIIVREMKICFAALALGFTFVLIFAVYTQAYAENVQNEIANNVIRFHVLANSDSAQDQALKNVVRDGMLDHFKYKLDPTASVEDTRIFLLDHLEEMQDFASLLVKNNGFNYSVQGLVDQTFFPTRTYGHMAFPAGEYGAFRIVIGNGKGSNWWCVMFPPLCYMDAALPAEDNHTLLRNLLSDETYALINHSQENASVRVRFKIVEWWQNRIHQQEQNPVLYIQG